MEIPIHANVSCYDGDVGKSTNIIVDLVTEQVTHFVIKTNHPSKEYVVPIDMIKGTERTVVLLDCHKEDVYQLRLSMNPISMAMMLMTAHRHFLLRA